MSDFEMRTKDPMGLMTITGRKGATYLVLRGYDGDYHIFVEIKAQKAAIDCGEVKRQADNTRTMWDRLWQRYAPSQVANPDLTGRGDR